MSLRRSGTAWNAANAETTLLKTRLTVARDASTRCVRAVGRVANPASIAFAMIASLAVVIAAKQFAEAVLKTATDVPNDSVKTV